MSEPNALRRRLLQGVGTSLLLPLGSLARAESTPVEPSALQRDVDVLRRAYTALHPGLYRYNTRAQLDDHFAALRMRMAGARTLADVYVALARFTATIRCGHTYPNFYNQGKTIRAALFSGADRLPFLFTWVDERMIVLDGLGCDPALVRGSEVLAINGMPVASILRALVPLTRADGSNDRKRVRQLDVRGFDTWEAFDVYFPLACPALVADGSVKLTLRAGPSTNRSATRVSLVTGAARMVRTGKRASAAGDDPLWTMSRPRSKVALLTMPTWGVYNATWAWEAWLNARLDTICEDGTDALVVDLRGNEGGQDCGDVIAARLSDADIVQRPARRLVRYRKVPDDILPFVSTWDASFKDWGDQAVGPDTDGNYRLTRWEDAANGRDRIRAAGRRFRGRVIVMIDASNSSATFQFAQTMKEARLATLVGQTTGGNQRGINGGAFLFLTLPESQIEVDIPLVGYFPDGPRADGGIDPDIPVPISVEDIAAGRDWCLETAMRLAASASRRS